MSKIHYLRFIFHGLRSKLWIDSVWNVIQHDLEHKRGWNLSIYPPPRVIPFGQLPPLVHSRQYLFVRGGLAAVPRVFAQQTTHEDWKKTGFSTLPSNRCPSRTRALRTRFILARSRVAGDSCMRWCRRPASSGVTYSCMMSW